MYLYFWKIRGYLKKSLWMKKKKIKFKVNSVRCLHAGEFGEAAQGGWQVGDVVTVQVQLGRVERDVGRDLRQLLVGTAHRSSGARALRGAVGASVTAVLVYRGVRNGHGELGTDTKEGFWVNNWDKFVFNFKSF